MDRVGRVKSRLSRQVRAAHSGLSSMKSDRSIEIRPATVEDASAIAEVLYKSFVEFEALYTTAGFAATVLNEQRVIDRMQEGPVWIASRDQRVLGTVAAKVEGDSVYIRGMAVLPAARGSGAGAALLRNAEDWAASAGYRHLFLSTTPFLSSAIHLYERSGFRRKSSENHDLFGTPLLTMEKTVRA